MKVSTIFLALLVPQMLLPYVLHKTRRFSFSSNDQLRSMDGMVATPGVMEKVKDMKKIVEDDILASIHQGKESDTVLLYEKAKDVQDGHDAYVAANEIEASEKANRDSLQSQAKACYKQVDEDTSAYIAHAESVQRSYGLEHLVCCKRDSDFQFPKVFTVGKGLSECHFESPTAAEDCTAEFMNVINAAELEVKTKGSDWESQNANCIQQQGVSQVATAKHETDYASLKNLVDSCTDDIINFNNEDNELFLLVTNNCNEYQGRYGATRKK